MVNRQAIAIIDDDATVRISLDSLLRAYGYTVHVFDSAEHFLESGMINAVDCLASDIQMPGINGLQMYERLMAEGNKVPVIFITASADQAPRLTAEKLGARHYLPKPFHADALINALEVVCNA